MYRMLWIYALIVTCLVVAGCGAAAPDAPLPTSAALPTEPPIATATTLPDVDALQTDAWATVTAAGVSGDVFATATEAAAATAHWDNIALIQRQGMRAECELVRSDCDTVLDDLYAEHAAAFETCVDTLINDMFRYATAQECLEDAGITLAWRSE